MIRMSQAWLYLLLWLFWLVGMACGLLWRHYALTRLDDRNQRLANRLRRREDHVQALTDELEWTRHQADVNAARVQELSADLATAIRHPAVRGSRTLRVVGRDQ